MNIEQLKIFLTLDKIGAELSTEVLKVQTASEYPLSMKEIFEVLEEFRAQDEKSKKPFFHQWFHQKEA